MKMFIILLLGGFFLNLSAFDSNNSFVFTVKTDNPGSSADNNFTISTYGNDPYDYVVDCKSDYALTTFNITGDFNCTYDVPGVYQITITGDFPRIHFDNDSDNEKMISIDQWGTGEWTSMERAFFNAVNLEINATDTPNLQNVTSMYGMFRNIAKINQDITDWNVSNVTSMAYMFDGLETFNQDIGNWDVSKVENMYAMFKGNTLFNQDIGSWDVSQVRVMASMFEGARNFNQDISAWDVSNVTSMGYMFNGARVFNKDISLWDVSKVDSFYSMFSSANAFNQDIGDWNTSLVTNMSSMFSAALAFNQDIGDWDISNVNSSFLSGMGGMFYGRSLSISNYDSMLLSWSKQSVNEGITLGVELSKSCEGVAAKNILTSNPNNWNILDSGADCNYHIDSPTVVYTKSGELEVTQVTTHFVAGIDPVYSIIGGMDMSLFSIDGASGVLSFLVAPDYNNPSDKNHDNIYRVQVHSTDGLSDDIQTVRVHVENTSGGLVPIINYLLF